MHLTAEQRQRLEEQSITVDLLSKMRLDEMQMPVVLRGDADHVYDLEPLIDYFVAEVSSLSL